MQPQSVITRMKPAFRAFVFAPPHALSMCERHMLACTHRTYISVEWVHVDQRRSNMCVCGSGPLRRTTPAARLAGREIRVSISALPPAKLTSRRLSLSGSRWSSTAGLRRGGHTSAATYKETACPVHHLGVGSVLVCFGAEVKNDKRWSIWIVKNGKRDSLTVCRFDL